jgi:hypothetical protein
LSNFENCWGALRAPCLADDPGNAAGGRTAVFGIFDRAGNFTITLADAGVKNRSFRFLPPREHK